MSRRNPTPLVVGHVYTFDRRKRRWTLEAIDPETGKVVLVSGDAWQVLEPDDAARRLKESRL